MLSPFGIFFRLFLCAILFLGSVVPVSAQSVLPLALPGDPLLEDITAPSGVIMKGVRVDPRNPLRMDFIFERNAAWGSSEIDNSQDSLRQIRYFLSSLVIPPQDLWINLSPYEKDRVTTPDLARTGMGQDLLVMDYLLKRVAAELVHPDDSQGKAFWAGVYADLHEKFGTTDLPVDTFNKVWITSDSARIFENFSRDVAAPGAAAVVTETRLKVLLEDDYRASAAYPQFSAEIGPGYNNPARTAALRAMREVVIPALEREVNESPRFARVREIYRCLVLATWYKKKLYDSVVARVYSDSRKTQGMDSFGRVSAETVWTAYMDSFRQGVFNLIREETDP